MPKFKQVPYIVVNGKIDFCDLNIKKKIVDLKINIPSDVVFGNNVVIEENAFLRPGVFIGNNSVIRENCVIGLESVIGHLVVVEADTVIGESSTIQSKCYIASGVKIGDKVFIGPSVCCVNDIRMVKYHPEDGGFIRRGPVFKDGCRIGANSTILPGVTIGKNAIVGAGSVVTKDVPDNETWVGYAAQNKDIRPAYKKPCPFIFKDPNFEEDPLLGGE